MKILSVVGARPQFIKAAAVSRKLRERHEEILVHTGQHYDQNMSAVFFEELGIPEPEFNLGIGSGNHGAQSGAMLAGIEEIILSEKLDWVLVYGDTNSTLAGALAASKLQVPVAHVEAGLRSFNRQMPEEINRILTDHVSTLLFCPSQTAVENLRGEGIIQGVLEVGDVMYDALNFAIAHARTHSKILTKLDLEENRYLLATVHRAENTDDPQRLQNILQAFSQVKEPLVFPAHPRTQKVMRELEYQAPSHVQIIDPVGYLDMMRLEENARMILTDSGGIQKEAYWLGIPCITLRDETEWVETVAMGWNVLVGARKEEILRNISTYSPPEFKPSLYGDGLTAERIRRKLETAYKTHRS